MRWRIPLVLEYDDPKSYFQSLIELNQGVPGFSQRNFARKIGWPISYLPDLLKQRKSFTVARALQFVEHFRLDPLSREKIVLFAVASQIPEFNGRLMELANSRHSVRSSPTSDPQLLNAKALLIFETVRWHRGKATVRSIADRLVQYRFSNDEVLHTLKLLKRKHLVEEKSGFYRSLREAFHTDDFGYMNDSDFHKECAIFFIRFMESKIGPAIYNSSFVHLSTSKFNEFANRIVALRNWIFEQSKVTALDSEAYDSVVFQLDLNLVPTFKRVEAKKDR